MTFAGAQYPKPKAEDLESNPVKYMEKLVASLENRDEALKSAFEERIKGSYLVQKENWTPTVSGLTIAGTVAYGRQHGVVTRVGIFVHAWFDVSWTGSGGATGALAISLPYRVADISGEPYIGPCVSGGIDLGSRVTQAINAVPNKFYATIVIGGTIATIIDLGITNIGSVRGSVRYMGVFNE